MPPKDIELIPKWKTDRLIELGHKEPWLSDDVLSERLGISIDAIEQIRRRNGKGIKRIIKGRKIWLCPHCDVQFKNKNTLTKHMKSRVKMGRCPIRKGEKQKHYNYVNDLKKILRKELNKWSMTSDVEHFT